MGTRARRWTVAVVAAALVAAGCSSSGSDGAADEPSSDAASATEPTTTTTTEATPEIDWPEPVFVEGDCPMPITDGVIVEVTCGTVDVPEDRTNPDSEMITLAVARLHSIDPDAAEDPVINLQGGPGFPSLENVVNASQSPILDHRDYILWDQRGVGFSEPNLDCDEVNDAIWAIFGTTDDAEAEGAVIEDAMRACRERLVADGVDLAGYDTTQNAADLADLRVALGVDEWNLRAISYGSALAIETIRNHPEGLRSVLLDSVVVPDEPFGAVARGEGALVSYQELYDACAEDADCAASYGDLSELFGEAAAALDADPYEVVVEEPVTGIEHEVAITGQDLWAGLFNALYDEDLIPVLPSVGQAIVDGDRGIIDAIARDGIPFAAGQAEGMTASVDCADRQALLDPDAVEPFVQEHPELGALVYLTVPETGCAEWDVPPASAEFNELLRGDDVDVPVMVMAGRFDPITPVAGTERVAEALGVELLLFPNAGHGAVGSSDCARDLWFAFMDDPSEYPDTSCMDDLGPPDFA